MKKIILMFLTLLMFVACRKAEEINQSLTNPSLVNKTPVSLVLNHNGAVIYTNDTLSSHLNELTVIETYSDGSTRSFTPTEDILSGWDSLSEGFELYASVDGLSASVSLSVSAIPLVPVSIELSTPLSYSASDVVTDGEFEITVTYDDGSTNVIPATLDMLTGEELITTSPGDETITITVTYEGLTDTLDVYVSAGG